MQLSLLSNRGLRAGVLTLAALMVASILAFTAWQIDTGHRDALARGEQLANTAVAALREHAAEAMLDATSPMYVAARSIRRAGGLARLTPVQVHELLDLAFAPGTALERLLVLDRKGRLVATSQGTEFSGTDFSKLETVARHLTDSTAQRVLVGKPAQAPGRGVWVIPVTQALRGADGRLEGVISGLFRVDYFKDFYATLVKVQNASVTLVRSDGIVLARHPFDPGYLGTDLSPALTRMRELRQRGLPVVRDSVFDGVARLYGWQEVTGFPLIVEVGLDMDGLLERWRSRSLQLAALAAAFTLVVATAALLLLRQARELSDLNAELEVRVRRRTAELAQATSDLEAFSYSVSHDLRAPIRRIHAFIELLNKDHLAGLPAEGVRYFRRVEHNLAQMETLVSDLLVFLRTGQGTLAPAAVNLSLLAANILADQAAENPGRRCSVSVETGMSACADPGLLRIVLINLLGNAWKFSAQTADARIEVGRLPQQDNAFFVRDNGAGFDMAFADKLFAPFQRLHAETEFEGTGIGLAIVKRIIARHGGRVWAVSAAGAGATICFTLPVDENCQNSSPRRGAA